MLDPRELVVYVVGIERYDGGEAWDLDGPVADALDFAEWLIERGVPPHNIQAFLAPLKHGDPLASRPVLSGKVKRRGATSGELYTALSDELNATKPKHFCLFWGGHGCLMPKGDRYLFGSESTAEHIPCINLTDFFRYLGTEALGPDLGRGSRQFITIVDACATFADQRGYDRSDHIATAHPFPVRQQVSRSWSAIFSTNPGEYALNLAQKTGLFSRELRRQLRRVTNSTRDLFQELETAAQQLNHTFDARSQNGESAQHPYFYSVRPFDQGERVLGNPRLEKIDQLYAPYTISYAESRELQVLINQIVTHIPESDVRRLFRIAVDVPNGGPESLDGFACLSDCTLYLAKGFPGPLFKFLALCRPFFARKAPTAAGAIDHWQRSVAARLSVNLELWQAAARNAKTKTTPKVKSQVIQLIVDPVFGPPGNERYQIRAAISDTDATEPAEVITVASSNAVLARLLPSELRTVFRETFSHLKTHEGLRIEAVLPAELLPVGAQRWIVRIGANDLHLSMKFALALRSHERRYHPDYSVPLAVQRDKWRSVKKKLSTANVAWSEDPIQLDSAALESWDNRKMLALFALRFYSNDGQRQARAVEQLISAGIPLAVWFHDPQQPANGWRESLRDNFMAQPCKNWPTRALDFHKQAQRSPACTGLVLLWDNPEQPLPEPPGRNRMPLQAPTSGSPS